MLKRIAIKGLLFIDEAELEFTDGFNAITGETGAGKSILLGALNICLGAKPPKGIINPRSNHFRVAVTFDLSQAAQLKQLLLPLLPEKQLGDTLTILTLLAASGELHYFINNIPTTAQQLQQLAGLLVDIHSQRQNQYLLKAANHVYFFDTFIGVKAVKSRYQVAYKKLQVLNQQLQELSAQQQTLLREKDFLEFTRAELKQYLSGDVDYGQLKTRLQELERRDKVSQQLFTFERSARAAVTQLEEAQLALTKAAELESEDRQRQTSVNHLTAQLADLNELCAAVIRSIDRQDVNRELDEIQQRLAGVEQLESKYGVKVTELTRKYQTVNEKLELLATAEAKLAELNAALRAAMETALAYAQVLYGKRHAGIAEFEGKFKTELAELGMESGKLMVEHKPKAAEQLNATVLGKRLALQGFDKLEFLYAAAKEFAAKPLKDIASGGELARMMLALKVLLSDKIIVGTMLFDELDTGVGGLTALRLAAKLKVLSQKRQLIVITHLPQLARVATRHFCIEKHTRADDATVTQVHRLNNSAIVAELCRMLGRNPTPENLKFAQKFIAEEA